MDKKLFVDTMNEIEKLNQEQEKFNDLLKEIDPDFGGCLIHNKTISLLEDLLSKLVNDKYGDIGYYMWELDFGKKYEEGMVTASDGTPIPLATAADLYELIMDNATEEE